MELTEELKEKVHKAFTEQDLVGMVSYTDDEYMELLAYTKKCSRSFVFVGGSYLRGDPEVHFVTLVELAKRWKSDDDKDEGFWRYVLGEILDGGDSPKLYSAYTDLINGLSYCDQILIADTAKKYYATIMMHAFAPEKSMNAFFDFVYNIFKKDLDFVYTDEDNEICNLVTEAFCAVAQSLGGKDIGVSIGSGVYGIKIGLRSMALGDETRDCFVELLDKVLRTMNFLYHEYALPDDDYVIRLVRDWWAKKADPETSPSGSKYQVMPTHKQNISIKFVRKGLDTYLCIPPIRFARGEYPKLWLSIYVGDQTKPIRSGEIFTRIGEITVTSAQQDIKLNDILRGASAINLRVEITENGKTIFDKTIEKDFILFDDEKELANRILKVGNYFVYSLSIDSLQVPTAITTVSSNLYNIYPTDGEILSSENRQIFFTSEWEVATAAKKVQLIGDSGICKWVYEDRECKVFSNRVNLLVPTDISVNSLEIRIDGKRTLLADCAAILEDNYSIFDITALIPQYVPCELIIYSYLKEKELIHVDIISISKLHIAFSKPLYYGDIDKSVVVSVEAQQKELTWETGAETVTCKICKGRLKIVIPQIKWRIDVGEWHYGAVEYIVWYKDYFTNGSVIEIQSPIDSEQVKLYCLADGALQEIPRDALSRFEIGKYIFTKEGYRNLLFFLKLNESDGQKELCTVTTIERFTHEPPFVVENGKLCFIGDKGFIGGKRAYFKICLRRIGKEEITKKSTELTNGVLADVDEGIYWIKVSTPSAGLFNSGEKILWQGEFVFGDREKLKLKDLVLKINPICGGGMGDSWKIISSGYYVTDLVREQDSDDTYSARLHYKNSHGEKSDVCGYTECRIVIISSIALQVCVKDAEGCFETKFKCDTRGNLFSPQSKEIYTATNYHFIEVKNV